MIAAVVKAISVHHFYRVDSSYWSRIGAMHKRFGEEVIIEAIKIVQEREIPLSDFLNILERRCQIVVENEGNSEITDLIFGTDDD